MMEVATNNQNKYKNKKKQNQQTTHQIKFNQNIFIFIIRCLSKWKS